MLLPLWEEMFDSRMLSNLLRRSVDWTAKFSEGWLDNPKFKAWLAKEMGKES